MKKEQSGPYMATIFNNRIGRSRRRRRCGRQPAMNSEVEGWSVKENERIGERDGSGELR
ncbi:hypothetical protein Hanom_Chr10g00945601 [Helianthus anomalus]